MTDVPDKRIIKVFIASPGDLAVERRAFKDQIDLLNLGFGDGAKVTFEPLGWEDALSSVGRRAQSVINADIDVCDVFILAMNRRWGQDAPDAEPYSSYTEEEFHRALARFTDKGTPEIFVFFKNVDAASMADPGEQLKKVLAFRKHLEQSRQVIYRYFADEKEFAQEVDNHLRAYAQGELPKADAPLKPLLLPMKFVEKVEQAEAKADAEAKRAEAAADKAQNEAQRAKAAEARLEQVALELAKSAAHAALNGQLEQARQNFALATDGTTSLQVLSVAFEFYHRTGDLDQGEAILERWLALSGPDAPTFETAAAYGNLGVIYMTRGDLDQAETMYRRALGIDEKLDHQEGIANAYANLGLIYKTRGRLDQAEAMLRKALEIYEKLGRLEGMASAHGNLGLIYQTRGDLDQAEPMLREALEIEKKLGRLEGVASQYSNLGAIYETRGDLDQAEDMVRKALKIDDKLGRLEGKTNHLGTLGLIYKSRGDLDVAEAMLREALEIDEKLGWLEGMASHYGNLGGVYQAREDMDQAEVMHGKALKINEKLGRLVGMAHQYGNLGNVYNQRGDLKAACEHWTQARDLFSQIGMPDMVKKAQGSLDELPDDTESTAPGSEPSP